MSTMADSNPTRQRGADPNPTREQGTDTNPPRERGSDNMSAGAESLAHEEQIAELDAQLHEANERTLRVQAELENYRKRAQREMADERRYAVVPLVRDLLSVVDNLDRAITAATPTRSASEGSSDADALLSGVQMVSGQLTQVLAQHQCVRIPAVGQPFDPNQHEAIAQEPSATIPAGHVSREVQVGYKLFDRVIRPVQVFVSTGKANDH
jgi:molecular chaperone GrpE